MDIEEEFEVKRQALELMKERIGNELRQLREKIEKAAHKTDEDMEKALTRAQEQLQALVDTVTAEDSKQQTAVEDLGMSVQRAVEEGRQALELFENMKASRQEEFRMLRQAIDDTSFDVDDHLTNAKRDLRNTREEMLSYIQQETKTRVQRFEELSLSVRNEFRGPR
jgi:hypothetical protein